MKFFGSVTGCFLFLWLAFSGFAAQAEVLVFQDRDSFLENHLDYQYESFESGNDLGYDLEFPPFTLTSAGLKPDGLASFSGWSREGLYSLKYQPQGTLSPTVADLVFSFESPITGFGLTFWDLASVPTGARILASLDGGPEFLVFHSPQQPISTEDFVGFISSTPFSVVHLKHVIDDNGGDTAAIDELLFILSPSSSSTPAVEHCRLAAKAYPNPFNPSTMVSFELGRDQHVKVSIFDLHGRLVRQLLNEQLKPGRHEFMWDGKDDLGNAVASGIYATRISAGNDRSQLKVTLLE